MIEDGNEDDERLLFDLKESILLVFPRLGDDTWLGFCRKFLAPVSLGILKEERDRGW